MEVGSSNAQEAKRGTMLGVFEVEKEISDDLAGS